MKLGGFYIKALLAFVFFLASQHFVSKDVYQVTGFSDTKSYIAMAECIQTKSCSSIGASFPSHHLERWAPHFAAGLLSSALDVDLDFIYKLIVFMLITIVFLLINSINQTESAKVVIFSFILFFPYGYRSFLYAPPMLADAIFFTAIFMFAISLEKNSKLLVYFALLLAGVSRQTAVLVIPILFFLAVTERISLKDACKYALALISVVASTIILSHEFFSSTSESTINHVLGLWSWLAEPIWIDLIMMLLGLGFFLILVAPAVLQKKNGYHGIIIFSLLCFISQPILAGPSVTGFQIIRLASYVVPFFALAFISNVLQKKEMIYVLLTMALFSMHHNYSITGNKELYFIFIVVGVAVLIFNKVFHFKSHVQ